MLHVSLAAEPLFHIGPLTVTNSLLTTWIGMAVLFLLVWLGTKKLAAAPRSMGQNLWEMVLEFFDDLSQSVAGKERKRQFLPLITAFFLFILTLNWMGLLPGVGTVGFRKESGVVAEEEHEQSESGIVESVGEEHAEAALVPLLRAGTADLNTTLALAVVAMLAVQYYALKNIGLGSHVKKFLNFSSPIDFFVGILELISEFAKVISFAFRLFGNVFAGEVLLAVIMFLVPFLMPLPFLGLEIFVGLIQAYVFAMLALVFLTIATEKHSH